AGGRVKRVRILGEDLVAFRAPSGRVGLLGEFCSHRRASLYFGRNEEPGLRCVYHGWQYEPGGRCIDMPNERPESSFQDKVTHPAYPCAERGGVVWAYMGPASPPPGLPDLEWTEVPEAQRFVSKFWQDCHYLQAREGGTAPAHISFLHGILDARDDGLRRALDQAAAGFGFAAQLERAPHIEVADTETGLLIGARREAPAGQYYWRVTRYLVPFHSMPPPEVGSDPVIHSHVWVPIDDDHLVNWCISYHPTLARAAGPGGHRHHPRAEVSARRRHRAQDQARAAACSRSRGLSRAAGGPAAAEGGVVGGRGAQDGGHGVSLGAGLTSRGRPYIRKDRFDSGSAALISTTVFRHIRSAPSTQRSRCVARPAHTCISCLAWTASSA